MKNDGKLVLERSTVSELNRLMYTLYKFFSVSLSTLSPEYDVPFNTADQIHLDSRPSDFYTFTCESSSIRIHQVRTHWTIECCGFVTKILPPYRPYSEHKYRNYFGDFDNFESAKIGFFMVLDDFIKPNLGALF